MLMPGREIEYTYSTPGTSRSSRSIGMLARCSTSAADAPGICTNTSSMGTTICGSSSRGVRRMANAPSSSENSDEQRRQLRVDELRRPALRQFALGSSISPSLRLNLLAAQLAIARLRHDAVAILQSRTALPPGRRTPRPE